jgi:transcription-repair coupling factor (superfamily II helicase)
MNSGNLQKLIKSKDFFSSVLNRIKEIKNLQGQIYLSQLSGSSKSFLVNELFENHNQLLILLPDVKTVSEFQVELSILDLSKNLISIEEFSPDQLQQKLTDLLNKKSKIILSTYDLLQQKFPNPGTLQSSITKINSGDEVGYENLIEYLNQLNYQKEKFVEAQGEYSQRGSLIDFWSYSEPNPVRLEFDGDLLESIRLFDSESQRSFEKTESVTLAAAINSESQRESSSNIFDYLEKPVVLASSFELENLDNLKTENKNESKTELLKIDLEGDEEEISEEIVNKEIEEIPHGQTILTLNDLFSQQATWLIEDELSSQNNLIDLALKEVPSINSNFEVLFSVLKDYADQNFDVILTSENELQTNRLRDLLSDFKDELSELIESGKIKLETLALKEGFLHTQKKILLLTDYQIFNKPYRSKLPKRSKQVKSKAKSFASIKRGDYVVHENYGIGKYSGLETIDIGESKQESMKLLYNEGGVVYVNLNYLHLVKRYSSNESLAPTLSILGSAEWDKTKKRTKKKIKEAARELIELYAKRKASQGFSFSQDSIWQKELEASFFYEDTPDQEKVTGEVKVDMEAGSPMDRLVCGDVGFGKTEIAVRAAFKSVQDGKQVALLVPTTILAEQHFNTFSDRLTNFPVRVAALSRFQTKKEQTETLKKLKAGEVDVIVGTHRLLSKDVEFKDIGLLIIDEEHRFGVTAKEKLRSIKINVDTLTLTATPIPRTLNLSLLGARDLSIISTPPPNRQPIYTTVSTFDILKIREWILNEVKRNGQIYFVHDRIQSIDKLNGYLQKYVPEVKVGIAHGQMKPSQLEEVIHKFLNKQYDVLLSTKIIESGIDIPNVNTIIVNRADRFGLAELHQLRGRVGRSTRQAFAYFIVPTLSGITKKALRRLQAIEQYTEIGSGFNLSMRDLEIRGAGNLLGREQSGFINEIGFDLYLKMIDEAVDELKYQEFTELFKSLTKHEDRTEPTIDCYFELGIPETYMPEQMDRLNFYTALYSIKNLDEMTELVEEMKDRFGPVPPTVNRLLLSAELKFAASYALFERIIMQRKDVSIILPKGQKEEYYQFKFVELMRFILDEHKDKVKFEQKNDVMKLIIKNNFDSPEKLLEFLINFSRDVNKLFQNPGSKEMSNK